MKLKNCFVGMRISSKIDFGVPQASVLQGYRSIKEDASYLFLANRFATIVSVEEAHIIVEAFGVTFKSEPYLWRKVVDNPVT